MARPSQKTSQKATDVGERLRILRKGQRLTQADLARQIGIQQSDLSRMEKGEYRVSLDNLFKILGVLNVEISDFFGAKVRQAETVSRPLSQEDMQTLHLLKQLSPEGRIEAVEFIEFKLRREQTERRAQNSRQSKAQS